MAQTLLADFALDDVLGRTAQDVVNLMRIEPAVLLEHERGDTRDMRCRGRSAEEVRQLVRRIVETGSDELACRAIAAVAVVVIERRVAEEESRVASVGTRNAGRLADLRRSERDAILVEINGHA